MARLASIKFLRTTRSALDTAAAANGLLQGEPYLITDEGRLAFGTGVGQYAAIPLADNAYVFTAAVPIVVAVGKAKVLMTRAGTVKNVWAALSDAHTGSSLIVDVNKNGTTIFTTQGNRPTIAAAALADATSLPDVTAFASGDVFTVDVDQIGTMPASAVLTVGLQVE